MILTRPRWSVEMITNRGMVIDEPSVAQHWFFFFICLNTANINTKKIHTFVFISVYLAPAPFFRCRSHIKEDFYWLYLVLLPGRRLPLIMSVTLSWEWSAVHLPSVFPPSSGLCLIKTEFKLESNGTVLWLCQLWCYCHCKFGNAL